MCVYGLCVYVWLSVSFCVLFYWSAVLANKRTHYVRQLDDDDDDDDDERMNFNVA